MLRACRGTLKLRPHGGLDSRERDSMPPDDWTVFQRNSELALMHEQSESSESARDE
jgi:hypothetical protein